MRRRNGNVKIIPNSILNTASLEKLNPSNEMLVRVPFTAKAGTDIDEMTRQVVQAVQRRDTADLADPRFPPKVRLTGYSPYGINVRVLRVRQAGIVASRHDQRRGTFHRQC